MRGRQLLNEVNGIKVFNPTKAERDSGYKFKIYAPRVRGSHDKPQDVLFRNQKDLVAYCKKNANK